MTKEELFNVADHLANYLMENGRQMMLKNAELQIEVAILKEREACAKICDERVTAYQYATDVWAQEHINEAKHLSQVIRARGKE